MSGSTGREQQPQQPPCEDPKPQCAETKDDGEALQQTAASGGGNALKNRRITNHPLPRWGKPCRRPHLSPHAPNQNAQADDQQAQDGDQNEENPGEIQPKETCSGIGSAPPVIEPAVEHQESRPTQGGQQDQPDEGLLA